MNLGIGEPFHVGDELTSGRLNTRAGAARSLAAAWSSGVVDAVKSLGARALRIVRSTPIMARLSGDGPAYDFTEVIDREGTGSTSDGARTGTAYEVNHITGLKGKIVRVYPDRFGDYRFQIVRRGRSSTIRPPSPCTITIHVAYFCTDGANECGPLEGATVTVCGYPSTPGPECVSGATGGDGNFTPPELQPGTTYTVTITYNGATWTQEIGEIDCPQLDFCYCETSASVRVVGGGGDLTVTNSEYGVVPLDPLTGLYTVRVNQIRPCYYGSSIAFWSTTGFTARSQDWCTACITFPYFCGAGDNGPETLTLFYFPDCYVSGAWNFPGGALPDFDDVNYRGLPCEAIDCSGQIATPIGCNPRKIQVRFSTESGPCEYFGDDAGTWIDLPILSNELVRLEDGTIIGRGITWGTGCRSDGRNNFLPDGGFVDCTPGSYTNISHYGSTKITLTAYCGEFRGNRRNVGILTYEMWKSGDCSIPPGTPLPDQRVYAAFSTEGIEYMNVAHPVNNTYVIPLAGIGSYRVELREAACP